MDECADSPCPEGSSCVNQNGSITCDCMAGWTGQFCEQGNPQLLSDNVC